MSENILPAWIIQKEYEKIKKDNREQIHIPLQEYFYENEKEEESEEKEYKITIYI